MVQNSTRLVFTLTFGLIFTLVVTCLPVDNYSRKAEGQMTKGDSQIIIRHLFGYFNDGYHKGSI